MIETTDEMWRLAREQCRLFELGNRTIEDWVAEMEPSVQGKQALAYNLRRAAQKRNDHVKVKLKHLCKFNQELYDMLIAGATAELSQEARVK